MYDILNTLITYIILFFDFELLHLTTLHWLELLQENRCTKFKRSAFYDCSSWHQSSLERVRVLIIILVRANQYDRVCQFALVHYDEFCDACANERILWKEQILWPWERPSHLLQARRVPVHHPRGQNHSWKQTPLTKIESDGCRLATKKLLKAT